VNIIFITNLLIFITGPFGLRPSPSGLRPSGSQKSRVHYSREARDKFFCTENLIFITKSLIFISNFRGGWSLVVALRAPPWQGRGQRSKSRAKRGENFLIIIFITARKKFGLRAVWLRSSKSQDSTSGKEIFFWVGWPGSRAREGP
jgi:hypothetical protein